MNARLSMTRALLTLLAPMPVALLIFSIACTRTVEVPVIQPAVTCPREPRPAFPPASSKPCGDLVCLEPDRAAAIWKWARDMIRRDELATVCLDARS
jgi:hypothetical protein